MIKTQIPLVLIIFFSFVASGLSPVNYYYWPAVAYTKNDGVLRGHGYFLPITKFRGIMPTKYNSTGRIFVLDGRKIAVDETDSLQIHQIMGYPDDTCWLFKVISGTISLYVHDLSPWLKYGVYPVNSHDYDMIEITPNVIRREKYIDRSYFNAHLLRLKHSFVYLQFQNEALKPYSDSLLCRLVSSKTTSLLYTQPHVEVSNMIPSPMAIVDFNRNYTIQQPYLDSLYHVAKGLKNNAKNYSSTFRKLRKAFSSYDAYNIRLKFQFYIENGIVYLKSGESIKGHVYFSLDFTESEKSEIVDLAVVANILGGASAALFGVGVFVIPKSKHFIGTFGIERHIPSLYSLYHNVPALFIDGQKIKPEQTDSIHVNGFTGYPDSLSWRFKVIDGKNISAYSQLPFRYLRKYRHLQKKDGKLHPFNKSSLKTLIEDYPLAYMLLRKTDADSLDIYRVLMEYNNHSLSFANQVDSLYKLTLTTKPGTIKHYRYSNKTAKYFYQAKKFSRADSVYKIYKRSKEEIPANKILAVDSLDYRLLCLAAKQSLNDGDKEKACQLYINALRYTRRDLELKPYLDNKILGKERMIRNKLKSLGITTFY